MVLVSNSKHKKARATFIVIMPHRRCPKDSLSIFGTMDGTGHHIRYPMCGEGRDMNVVIDTDVAYVKFKTDGGNRYPGYRGFYATFNAEGPSTTL